MKVRSMLLRISGPHCVYLIPFEKEGGSYKLFSLEGSCFPVVFYIVHG